MNGLGVLQDLKELFGPFGTVQECRILHRGDDIRGAGALVRMNSVSAASQAILALHGQYPQVQPGEISSLPLLGRYADSPEEKARKQARKEQLAGRQHRCFAHILPMSFLLVLGHFSSAF